MPESSGAFADNAIILSNLARNFPDAVKISVRTGEGLEDLKKAIEAKLFNSKKTTVGSSNKNRFSFQPEFSI